MLKFIFDHKWQIGFLIIWLVLMVLSNFVSFPSTFIPGKLKNAMFFISFYSFIIVSLGYILMRRQKTGHLQQWSKLAQGLIATLLILVLLDFTFPSSYGTTPPSPDQITSRSLVPPTPIQYAAYEPPPFPGTFARVSKYILLATKSNQELIKFYKISAGSESIVSKKSLRLTDKTGWPGCSSFMGTYSTCKNAVWFSANGQKAVIQTEKQSGPLEEPPYWTAWYLMDLSTGQLSEIYRIYSDQDPDFTLVEWLYDRGENVFIQARTDLSNQNLRKYYQLNIGQKTLSEIPSDQYPDLFQDYSLDYFSLTEDQNLNYVIDGKSLVIPIKLSHISEILGVEVIF